MEKKFTHTARTVTLKTADNKDTHSRTWQKRLYSVDQRLSIAHQGFEVKAFLFDDKDLGEALGDESMRVILEFCAQFLDLESLMDKTSGKATRKNISAMLERANAMLKDPSLSKL